MTFRKVNEQNDKTGRTLLAWTVIAVPVFMAGFYGC